MKSFSCKPTSTAKKFRGPGLKEKDRTCAFIEKDNIIPPLSRREREAILDEPNKLWEFVIGNVVKPALVLE